MDRLVALLFALAAGLGTAALAGPYRSFLLGRGQVKANYRGVPIPCGVGFVGALWAALLLLVAGRGLAELPVIAAGTLFFAGLGLLDDFLGDRSAAGLRGHLGRALRGELTSGAIKAAGGAGVSIAVAVALGGTPLRMGLTALLLALAANAANLLDARPGRALKVTGAVALLLCAAFPGAAAGVTLGTSAALLPDDIAGRQMLGDAGSNALGFLMGAALTQGPLWLLASATAALGLLHVGTERGSISAYVDAHAWLRYLDRLGRPH